MLLKNKKKGETSFSLSDQRKFHKIERDYELDPTEQKCGESGKKDILGWIWEESVSKQKRR